jgi:hypothetical protein
VGPEKQKKQIVCHLLMLTTRKIISKDGEARLGLIRRKNDPKFYNFYKSVALLCKPTVVSYNASAVNICNTTSSLVRIEIKK